MALTKEWRSRIDLWRKALKKDIYRPLNNVEFSAHITKNHVSASAVSRKKFKPMPEGTPWGAKWEYGWFRGKATIPSDAAGKHIVLNLDTGAESLIYINGKIAMASDKKHHFVTLSKRARKGDSYSILAESYAGHGKTPSHIGPLAPGQLTIPEPPARQCVVGNTTFGVWEEDVYQLLMDVDALIALRDSIDPNSLRTSEIDKGLRDFTVIADMEAPFEKRIRSYRKARQRLKPLLSCRNGSTAPVFYGFGHAHLDIAWLWPIAETNRKSARTVANQLALAEAYPEYKFIMSQPYVYEVIKKYYPAVYKRLKRAVKAGRIIADGGMWVEADTNIPSGESLIRQFLHGKRYFRENFGIESELLWLPDVFGYSGALPQIMQGCGVKYFATSKLLWHLGAEAFPYNSFTWQGIDGSSVLAHLYANYNSDTDPRSLVEHWNNRSQKNDVRARLLPFGHGDGGGGPSRDYIEMALRAADLEDCPKVKLSTPADFFREQEKQGWPPDQYVGELYFQMHRGTYTTQGRLKLHNRKCEIILREAEMWSTASRALKNGDYPYSDLDAAWKTVLVNQFHDIIPGSSIQRVNEEALDAYKQVFETAENTARKAARTLVKGSRNVTLFNSLGWERKELVKLPDGFRGAKDQEGNVLPAQNVSGDVYTEALLPSCGWRTLRPSEPSVPENRISASEKSIENEILRARFNSRGEMTSCYDKSTGEELLASPANVLKMYQDIPSQWDAWDIHSMYPLNPVELDEPAKAEVVSSGPLFARIRFRRKIHESTMTQTVTLKRNSRRIDFDTVIDWKESHKLLKAAFPVNTSAARALHEIQCGHFERPNHYSRQYDADRFEVSNHKWSALVEENRGFAVLNDCKYGINILGNSMNLSLLRSPKAPDMQADICEHRFTYSFYTWNGSFAKSDIVHESFELNVPVLMTPGTSDSQSLFSVDNPDIIIDTVKAPEDGSKGLIVRMYESKRTTARCSLCPGMRVSGAWECDMLENRKKRVATSKNNIQLRFRPFEIKTLKLETD